MATAMCGRRLRMNAEWLWRWLIGVESGLTLGTRPSQWKLRRGTSSKFENEAAQIRCLFQFFRVFGGQVGHTADDSPPLISPWRRHWKIGFSIRQMWKFCSNPKANLMSAISFVDQSIPSTATNCREGWWVLFLRWNSFFHEVGHLGTCHIQRKKVFSWPSIRQSLPQGFLSADLWRSVARFIYVQAQQQYLQMQQLLWYLREAHGRHLVVSG